MSEVAKTASCLCGGISFEIAGPIHHVRFCHCANCRKFSGASHSAWGLIDTAHLIIGQLNTSITRYNAGNGFRAFCSNCGSPLWYEPTGLPHFRGIPLGVIDRDESVPSPELHVWTRSKVSWAPILDDLPQYETHPYAASYNSGSN